MPSPPDRDARIGAIDEPEAILPSDPLRGERRMISPEEALRIVEEAATPRPPRRTSIVEACGRVLAEPIVADRDCPPFARAMMDGFAVTLASRGRAVPVVGEVAAGDDALVRVTDEGCVEILTGARCPPGTEAVVQKERIRRRGDVASLPSDIEPGQNIAPRGSECRAGRLVLQPGDTIGELGVAAMAAFGIESVLVTPPPRLALITTGAEVVGPGRPLGSSRIRDSNGPMLAALARSAGLDAPPPRHRPDDKDAILDALRESEDRDLVVLAGGVSAGRYDLVPAALLSLGAEIVFHKVRQKPGKPLLLARRGAQLLFGLPGNPLACHLGFSRYVAAAVRAMAGLPPLRPLAGTTVEPVLSKPGRTHFVPCRAEWSSGGEDGWRLRPLRGAGSADVFACTLANAYLEVPPGNAELPPGTRLPFRWIAPA